MKRLCPIILLLLVVPPSLGLDVSITTGFAGTNQANGNIFTIKAKSQPISITSFDINMSGPPSPNPAPLEVHFLPGIDPGYSDPQTYPYQMIFQGDIAGQGKGSVTSLPDFTNPVVIPAGATYSFYITVADLWLGTNLWYNIGSAVGSVVASDQYMEIGEGYALGYAFLGYSDKRRWNGNVYYSIGPIPTGSPIVITPPPTQKPTTSSPTPHPTPTNDALDPTKSPTQSPVQVQSPPTQSPQQSSDSPTKSPIGNSLNPPTEPPTVAPPPPTTNNSNNGNGDDDELPSPSSASPSKKPTSSPSSSSSSGNPTLFPSLPPMNSNETSESPTRYLNVFLPSNPTPSSSVKMGIYLGHFCIVSALVIAVANY
eukprot:CAMPEP_0201908862 /NCGR_PEP_ID=MMETSP0903-20130614/840_1 /ASSEMBLY_ACC=CAM_ASM_000552 /TAXON_ID=420261 /ORGANISM="Thalassiosira antarctica, Strain CCMP982" /LENGTH=368 /DNA_ID=CAMNT_0048443295 /DNA_START=177 /DNA_END=1283 /DNA_ORIENTATION=-